MSQTSAFTPQDMIRYAAVPDLRGVFALGCFERRVTVYSQQVRALNFVYALFETQRLKPNARFAVVGGGFAGLTVAAAAVQKGATVTLFERESRLLKVQADCTMRRIHPNIFDWPADGSEQRSARLPVLTWTENTAGSAAKAVLRRWAQVPGVAQIEQKLDHTVTGIESGAIVTSQPTTGEDQTIHPPFDCVVVCAGFGAERDVVIPYWDRRTIEVTGASTGCPQYLVSGLGDGAVADVLSLRLGDPRRPLDVWLANEALPRVPPSLRADILRIEREAQLIDIEDKAACAAHYARSYARHFASGLNDLFLAISKRRRPDTEVLWAGPLEYPYDRGATPLNRFVVAALRRIEDRRLTFEWAETERTSAGLILKPCDGRQPRTMNGYIWAARHGADVPRLFQSLFGADVAERLQRGITKFGFDAPRTPIWPSGYFKAPSSSPSPAPPASLAEDDSVVRLVYAVMDPESAAVVRTREAVPASAALRSDLGYGLLVTAQESDVVALAEELTAMLGRSIATTMSETDDPPRPFEFVPVYIRWGETVTAQALRKERSNTATNLERLVDAKQEADPTFVAVTGEMEVGNRRIEVHSIPLGAFERVRLRPPHRRN